MATVQQVVPFLTLTGNLLMRFIGVVQAFDAHDTRAVGDFLDDNVILDTLTPPVMIIGKTNVLSYLDAEFKKDPSIYFGPVSTNVSAPTATVSGRALWIDNDTGPAGEFIHYSFTFVLHTDGNWYVINLWGTPN
jgi:hypothetical protein